MLATYFVLILGMLVAMVVGVVLAGGGVVFHTFLCLPFILDYLEGLVNFFPQTSRAL